MPSYKAPPHPTPLAQRGERDRPPSLLRVPIHRPGPPPPETGRSPPSAPLSDPPVARLAERPAALGGQDHVGLAHGWCWRHGSSACGSPLCALSQSIGSSVRISNAARLPGAAADLLEVQPARAQQLSGDAVRAPPRRGAASESSSSHSPYSLSAWPRERAGGGSRGPGLAPVVDGRRPGPRRVARHRRAPARPGAARQARSRHPRRRGSSPPAATCRACHPGASPCPSASHALPCDPCTREPGDEFALQLGRPAGVRLALARHRLEVEQRRDLGIGRQFLECGDGLESPLSGAAGRWGAFIDEREANEIQIGMSHRAQRRRRAACPGWLGWTAAQARRRSRAKRWREPADGGSVAEPDRRHAPDLFRVTALLLETDPKSSTLRKLRLFVTACRRWTHSAQGHGEAGPGGRAESPGEPRTAEGYEPLDHRAGGGVLDFGRCWRSPTCCR